MGCAHSSTVDTRASRVAEREMANRRKEMASEIKLLLLGTGESGKSTITKQIRILHTDGYSAAELLSYRPIIYNNIVTVMKSLIEASQMFGYQVKPENNDYVDLYANLRGMDVTGITAPMKKGFHCLWNDPAIVKSLSRSNEFQLMDSSFYLADNLDRFADSNFIPSLDDVLRIRARTVGISEIHFKIENRSFTLVDVGGQRSERRKWMHCFEDVTAILFCVALNEYDLKLFEDEDVNRMVESLELFEQIANSQWFASTAIILFLNKMDLFREKIKKVPLQDLFPEYEGGVDPQAGAAYIEKALISRVNNPSAKIFSHQTTATDTGNVKIVFDAVRQTLLSNHLEKLGFGM
ncbi:guanine nucleotide-binding protein alpha-1 subunit [Planoprotostelium fungivorum]|uniref:Guanine nucleotide-binding protein alpha-1 subunit n=1 Tax=Planoprotostelium fungivorum TaxID=1890364 RepID=A0A2P6MNA8_9EUKA|nr:guanine nucleotide-binding protein alpha-1 subunit [Planoprotostelium fungivorum]